MPAMAGTTGTTLSFSQIEQLWIQAGGDPAWAPTMAGIALVESGGLTNNLNNNAQTKDFSVGLWQINYFGSLGPARAPKYGEPAALAGDPLAQAKAAVDILGGGGGISAWAGDTVGNFAQNGKPLSAATVTSILKGAGISTSGSSAGSQTDGTIPGSGTDTGLTVGGVNPLDPLGIGGSTVDAISGLGTLVGDLTSAAFWKRIGVFTLGGAVLTVGLVVFFVSTPEGQKIVSEGAQVGATAALA
jgi:hypothetical protein